MAAFFSVAALALAGITTMLLADVADPPAPPDATADISRTGPSRTRLACEPVGCELWRVDDVSVRPVLVSDAVVVSLGRDEVVGYDTGDGRVLWRFDVPGEINPNAAALSDQGLAMVITEPDGDGTVVAVHDPVDGTRRFDVPVAGAAGSIRTQVAWLEGHLVVVGSPRTGSEDGDGDGDATRPLVQAFSPDGSVVWSRTPTGAALVLDDPPAVLLLESGVTRLDPTGGGDRWRAPAPLASLSADGDRLLTLEEASGTVAVIDFATGATSQSIIVEGARNAFFLGPWVAIDVGDELRLHDPADGAELFRRPTDGDDQRPPARPSAVAVGDRVAVMGLDIHEDDGVELATYTSDGELEASVDLPFDEPPVHPVLLEAAAGDVVHVASRGGPGDGLVVTVDLGSQRVIDVQEGRWALRRDGLLLVGVDQGVRLISPHGEMLARHAPHVASTDPLVVHGAGGILRLDADQLRQQTP